MFVMYLWVIGIDVGHVFVGYRYRCWLCISGLYVSMLVMYVCIIGIDVGYVFVGYLYRFWSCICVLQVSMLVMYLCVIKNKLLLALKEVIYEKYKEKSDY
jgi:hypothetical protein